jgi:hypothetical protein
MNNKKILISIVNYCDPEFYNTVKILWDTAEKKENLIFSLVSEDYKEYDFPFIPEGQMVYKHFDPSIYRGGLCWARNLATKPGIEYDYLVQFDSHTHALLGWDTKVISDYNKILKIKNTNFILCYAPPPYEILEDGSININIEPKISKTANNYESLVPGFLFPKYREMSLEEVSLTYWPTCAFLFAPKAWVDQVGFNEKSAFNTEEIDLALNTFYKGWSIYSIGARDVFHNTSHRQSNGSYTRFEHRPWADERKEHYWQHTKEATDYTARLLSGKEHIPIKVLKIFFDLTKLNIKYLKYDPDYYYHIKTSSSPFDHVAMPPRKDILSYQNKLMEHPLV